jgi:pimeloyl-ACP methyl ester carboxylesterase
MIDIGHRSLFTRSIDGDGAPVVLLHGVGASHTTWNEVPALLAAVGIGSVAIDLPGHGVSSEGDYTIASFAESTLRHVVDHRGQRANGLEALAGLDASRVLITWGARDGVLPIAHGERAHALLPGSRFEVFSESGHLPHRDDPGRFAIAIAELIRTAGDSGCVRADSELADAG